MVESLLFYRSWSRGPEPAKKILGAGAGQKWTGSATLPKTVKGSILKCPILKRPSLRELSVQVVLILYVFSREKKIP